MPDYQYMKIEPDTEETQAAEDARIDAEPLPKSLADDLTQVISQWPDFAFTVGKGTGKRRFCLGDDGESIRLRMEAAFIALTERAIEAG